MSDYFRLTLADGRRISGGFCISPYVAVYVIQTSSICSVINSVAIFFRVHVPAHMGLYN